jgi:hypothetical protein
MHGSMGGERNQSQSGNTAAQLGRLSPTRPLPGSELALQRRCFSSTAVFPILEDWAKRHFRRALVTLASLGCGARVALWHRVGYSLCCVRLVGLECRSRPSYAGIYNTTRHVGTELS